MEESKQTHRSSLSPSSFPKLSLKKTHSLNVSPSAVKLTGHMSSAKKNMIRSPKKPIVAPKPNRGGVQDEQPDQPAVPVKIVIPYQSHQRQDEF